MTVLRRSLVVLALLTVCAALPSQVAADPETFIYLLSEPGDYIGGGREYYRDASSGTFSTPTAVDRDGDGLVDYVSFNLFGPPGQWISMDFATNRMPGTNLAPGFFYDNARRAPFAPEGHPGLAIGVDHRGCNTLTGSFTIVAAEFDYSMTPPRVVSFAAFFEQHCEGAAPALHGMFYYNYDPGK